ncbi:hypothetical protein SAMN05444394_1566 [Algoriphagus halophilus]|uniref:Uncharacterized protein n=2 Tax=Algoriphagus halophilus TaxID=226505 RepID=A0A1N6DZM5_9BACT|nr:hypothetical protein SAMN05444394_1566 [Algoriphagus halophilus]
MSHKEGLKSPIRATGIQEFLKEFIHQIPEFLTGQEIELRITCTYNFTLAPNLEPVETPVLLVPNFKFSAQKESIEEALNKLVLDIKSRLSEWLSDHFKKNEFGEFQFEVIVLSRQKKPEENRKYVGVYPLL